jgi:hypothetical protein
MVKLFFTNENSFWESRINLPKGKTITKDEYEKAVLKN